MMHLYSLLIDSSPWQVHSRGLSGELTNGTKVDFFGTDAAPTHWLCRIQNCFLHKEPMYHKWSFSEAKRLTLSTLNKFVIFSSILLFSFRINVVSRTMQHSTYAHRGAERRFI